MARVMWASNRQAVADREFAIARVRGGRLFLMPDLREDRFVEIDLAPGTVGPEPEPAPEPAPDPEPVPEPEPEPAPEPSGPEPFPAHGSFIDDPFVRAERNALAELHELGLNDLGGFAGVVDTAGYNVVIATSAQEMASAISSTPLDEKRLILCRWSGISSTGAVTQNGPSDTALRAAGLENPDAPGGFDMPARTVCVRADDGFAPVVGYGGTSTSVSINLRGQGRVHFDEMEFIGQVQVGTISSRPLLGVVAFTGCRLVNINAPRQITCHVEDCVFDDPGAMISAPCDNLRILGCEFRGKTRTSDLLRASGYSAAHQAGKRPNIWIAHNILHSCTFDTASPNHFDAFQWTLPGEVIEGTNILVEFNILNANIRASQGLFGDDGGNGMVHRFVAHNNIVTVTAFHGITPEGRSGRDTIAVYRNIVARAAGASDSQPTAARISIWQSLPNDGVEGRDGRYLLAENIANSVQTPGTVQATVRDNVIVSANEQDAAFQGNGTWAVNGIGQQLYDDPGLGMTRPDAFMAIRDFYRPSGGYRAAGAGCTDPLRWPAGARAVL